MRVNETVASQVTGWARGAEAAAAVGARLGDHGAGPHDVAVGEDETCGGEGVWEARAL